MKLILPPVCIGNGAAPMYSGDSIRIKMAGGRERDVRETGSRLRHMDIRDAKSFDTASYIVFEQPSRTLR
jgi:hypothetical protein